MLLLSALLRPPWTPRQRQSLCAQLLLLPQIASLQLPAPSSFSAAVAVLPPLQPQHVAARSLPCRPRAFSGAATLAQASIAAACLAGCAFVAAACTVAASAAAAAAAASAAAVQTCPPFRCAAPASAQASAARTAAPSAPAITACARQCRRRALARRALTDGCRILLARTSLQLPSQWSVSQHEPNSCSLTCVRLRRTQQLLPPLPFYGLLLQSPGPRATTSAAPPTSTLARFWPADRAACPRVLPALAATLLGTLHRARSAGRHLAYGHDEQCQGPASIASIASKDDAKVVQPPNAPTMPPTPPHPP